MRRVRILSLDGGGIRGIIPGVVLAHLEAILQRKAGDSSKRLADYFELMAGTSTGGILACGYLCPDKSGISARYSASRVLDKYLELGRDVFTRSIFQSIRSLKGLRDEKYAAAALERALANFFEDEKLDGLLKPCLIPAYNIYERRAKFFNKTDARSESRNFKLRDVARATSAAPTYFEAAELRSPLDVRYPMIDGALVANNPAMCAYTEARGMDFGRELPGSGLPNCPAAKDMLLLSIGTGQTTDRYLFRKAKDWGAVEWIGPVLDIMMTASSETVDYQLRHLFGTHEGAGKGQYIRLNPSLHHASRNMDEVTQLNIDALKEAGSHFISENEEKLNLIAEQLIEAGPSPKLTS